MSETAPDLTPLCPRCGSDALIPDAFLFAPEVGTALKLQVGVYRKPDALMMKAPVRTEIQVRLCGDCGAIGLTAEDPDALWDAHIDRLTRQLDA